MGKITQWFQPRRHRRPAPAGPVWMDRLESRLLLADVPATPADFAVTSIATNALTLAWTDTPDETAYRVDQLISGAWKQVGSTLLDADTTSLALTGLTPGATYSYRIRAKNEAGLSLSSPTVEVATLPAAPANLSAAVLTKSRIKLTWGNVSGEDGFDIYVSSDEGITWSAGGTVAADVLTYTVAKLTPDTFYLFQVTASNNSGDSADSNTAEARTLLPAPGPLTAASVAASEVLVSWTDLPGATGYKLEQLKASAWTQVGETLDSDATTTALSGLAVGSVCSLRLRALNGAGPSAPSDVLTVTTLPGKPAVTTTAAARKIRLAWGAVTGAAGYTIEQSPDGTGSWTVVGTADDDMLRYAYRHLTPDTQYWLRVIPENDFGVGTPSDVLPARTLLPPPGGLIASNPTSNSITLAWDEVAGATGYRVEKLVGAVWTPVGATALAADTTTTTVGGLSAGVGYSFRIKAVSDGGDSNPSAAATLATLPAGPTVTATGNHRRVTLNWGAVLGATGYAIEQSPDNAAWVRVGTTDATTLTYAARRLDANTTYFFRLTAENDSGDSDYSTVISRTTLMAPPTGLLSSSTSTSAIVLTWTDSTGETGYRVEKLVGTVWTRIASLVPADTTTYTVTALTAGTAYQFRLRALSAAGESQPSPITLSLTCPAAPVLAATAQSDTEIRLSWPAVASAIGYEVDKSDDGGTTWEKIATPATNGYVATGLEAYTPYSFRVRAVSEFATSPDSAVATRTTLPSAPTGLAASSPSATSVTLTWPAATAATGYKIERLSGTTWIQVGSPLAGTARTYTVSGLSAGTTYSFRLKAVTAQGDTAGSIPVARLTRPAAPVVTATVKSTSQIDLTWPAVASATSYEVDSSPDNITWTQSIATPATNTYSATDLALDTPYFFRVRAVNGSGASVNSAAVTKRTLVDAPALVLPAPLPGGVPFPSASANSFTLSWTDSVGETGYRVEKLVGTTWTRVGLLIPANTTTYNVTGLAGGTRYEFRVRTVNAGGDSLPSGSIACVTLPTAPVVTAAAISDTGIDLTWPAVTGAAGYEVDSSSDNITWSNIAAPETNSYSVTGLSPNTRVYFRVRAQGEAGFSAYSTTVNKTTLLPAPIGLTATSYAAGSISFTWTDGAGETGYRLEKLTGTTWGPAGTTFAANITSYNLAPLTAGTSYQFRLRAINISGDSAPSETVTCLTLPGTPTLSATVISDTQIGLSWTGMPSATKYEIDQSTDGTIWTSNIATTTAPGYSVTGLAAATRYYFRVRAVNGSGNSANSPAVNKTTLPAAPTGLAVSAATATSLTLTWTDVASETGYKVERLDGVTWTQVGGTLAAGTTTYTATGLTGATSYAFRLKAVYATGDSVPSAAVTGLTRPATPALVASASSSTQVDLTWPAVSGADSLRLEQWIDGAWTTVGSFLPGDTASASITDLAPATTYSFRLIAINASGESDPSALASATTLNDLIAPVAEIGI